MASGLVVASATVAHADDGGLPRRPDAIIGSSILTSGGIPGKGIGDPAFVAAKVAIAALYGEVRAGRAPLDDYVTQRRVFESQWSFATSPRALNETDQAAMVKLPRFRGAPDSRSLTAGDLLSNSIGAAHSSAE